MAKDFSEITKDELVVMIGHCLGAVYDYAREIDVKIPASPFVNISVAITDALFLEYIKAKTEKCL